MGLACELRLWRLACSALVAALVLLGAVAQCGAHWPSVSISPETPTDADSLRISVGGWLIDGCWSFQGVQCGHPEAGAIGIDVFLHQQSDTLAILQDLVRRLGVTI